MAKNGTLAKSQDLQPSFQTTTEQITIGIDLGDRFSHRYTPSILRMIRSAHWTALAINDSVLGLGRDSCRSSGFFRCRATKIAAAIAKTRFRPSSMRTMLAYSPFVRYSSKISL
jgi:hypothetical protein